MTDFNKKYFEVVHNFGEPFLRELGLGLTSMFACVKAGWEPIVLFVKLTECRASGGRG